MPNRKIKGSGNCQSGIKGDVLENCPYLKRSSSLSSSKSSSLIFDPEQDIRDQIKFLLINLKEELHKIKDIGTNGYFYFILINPNMSVLNSNLISISMNGPPYISILNKNIRDILNENYSETKLDELTDFIIEKNNELNHKDNYYTLTYFITEIDKGILYNSNNKEYKIYTHVISRINNTYNTKKDLVKEYPQFKSKLISITRIINIIKKIVKLSKEAIFAPGTGSEFLKAKENFNKTLVSYSSLQNAGKRK